MSQLLSSIDIFGTSYEFSMGPKRRYGTFVGSICSCVCLIMVSASIYLFSIAYIDDTKPLIAESLELQETYPKFDLVKEEFFLAFAIYDGEKYIPADQLSRFITVTGLSKTITHSGLTETPNQEIKPITFATSTSAQGGTTKTILSHFANLLGAEWTGRVLLPELEDNTDWMVQSSYIEPPFTSIELHVLPCTLPDPATNCASIAELSKATLIVPQITKSMDPTKKEEPLSININIDHELLFNRLSRSIETIFLKENLIKSEKNRFFSEPDFRFVDKEKIISSLGSRDNSISCSLQSLIQGTCVPYASLEIRSGGRVSRITRTYTSVVTTISELGGFGDIVYIVLGFFYMFYNKHHYDVWIKNQLFDEDFLKAAERNFEVKRAATIDNHDEKTPNMKKAENGTVGGLVDKVVEEQLDAVKFIQKVQKLNLLFDVVFTPEMKVLMPELAYRLQKDKMKVKRFFKGEKIVGKKRIGFDEALKRLREWDPQNGVHVKLKEFIFERLSMNSVRKGPGISETAEKAHNEGFGEEKVEEDLGVGAKDGSKKVSVSARIGRIVPMRSLQNDKNPQKPLKKNAIDYDLRARNRERQKFKRQSQMKFEGGEEEYEQDRVKI